MAASAVGSVTWIWLMMVGGLAALPFGGAPLPLDPQLSAIAPPECLWYASSSGQSQADGESSNQTEQLLAEPQVREFFSQLETQILRAVRRAAGPGSEQRVLTAEAPILVKALVTRPFVLYLEDAAPRDDGVEVEAAFVLNAGDQRTEIEDALTRILTLAEGQMPPIESENLSGITWSRLATPPQAPVVRFGWHDEYLILAVGQATPAKLLSRLGGAPPEWLTHIRDEHDVPRELSIGYLNVAGIVQRISPFVRQHEAWSVVEQLGLFSIKEVHGVSGFDEIGCISEAHLVTDGQRQGLLGLLPYKPLSKRDLEVVPRDSLIALAARVDAAEAWDAAVRLIARFEPRAEDQIDRSLWEIETRTGVDVRGDVLRSLDDVWLAYLPSGDLLTSWINSAAAVRVKDADQLQSAIEKLVDAAKAEMRPERQSDVSLTDSTVNGNTIYTLQFTGGPSPVAPSWSVSDEWLVIGLLPSAVRSALDREPEESLADVEGVREALSAPEGPAVLGYQDTPQLARSLYPWLQMGAQMASSQLRREGIEIDATALPSIDVIVKHLRPDVSTVTHTTDGFRFTSRSSLPGGGNLAAAAPIGVALLLPAVSAARSSARVVTDMNDLKQLCLAALNYESANGAFPTDVYDENGDALLSWRIRLLPYMEEQALYEQFRLDEPWDSEHNRGLIDQMPDVLRCDTDPAERGKTRYLALKGNETVFTGAEPTRMRSIQDGTSNTILFVQAVPDAAVEWTRPADIDYDADRPFASLESPRGFFLTARCDGSVFRFELAAGAEAFKAMATRAGGERVEYPR